MDSLATHKVVVELSANFAAADAALKKLEARADQTAQRVGGSMSKLERLGARGRGVSGLKGVAAGLVGGAVGGPAGFIAGMATFAAVNFAIEFMTKAFTNAADQAEKFAGRMARTAAAGGVASGAVGKSLRDMLNPADAFERSVEDAFQSERKSLFESADSDIQKLLEQADMARKTIALIKQNVPQGSPSYQTAMDKAEKELRDAEQQLEQRRGVLDAGETELRRLRDQVLERGQGRPTFDTIGTVFGSMKVAAGGTKKPATEDGQKRLDTATQRVAKAAEGVLRFLQRSGLEGFA